MAASSVTLVGRSSSHFTRVARLFALELGIPHNFQPVLDITTTDVAAYAGNPALKVPVLVDEDGPLFGTEAICRALVRRAGKNGQVVLRGESEARLVANAEEMVLHAMNTEVTLIMNGLGPDAVPTPPKVRRSLENALGFLEAELERVVALLPPARLFSFFEVALFCTATHLPFRKILQLDGHPRIESFARTFGGRASAQATPYKFDAA